MTATATRPGTWQFYERDESGLTYVATGKPVKRWEEIRTWVLERDSHQCQRCGQPATDVDHIWPRRHGGPDHVRNLRALCGPCNKTKSSKVDWANASHAELNAASGIAWTRAHDALLEYAEVLLLEHGTGEQGRAQRMAPMRYLAAVCLALGENAIGNPKSTPDLSA